MEGFYVALGTGAFMAISTTAIGGISPLRGVVVFGVVYLIIMLGYIIVENGLEENDERAE